MNIDAIVHDSFFAASAARRIGASRRLRRALAAALIFGCLPYGQAFAETTGGSAMKEAGLTVVARITASPGNEAKLLDALRDDERQTTTKEAGCLTFQVLTRDGHPNEFVLYEAYRDMAAFEAHKSAPYFASFEQAVKRFGAGPPVIKLFKEIG